ncbi:hypothetical protein [Methylobacterium aquaticum]|uniref:hypothetical protein n=1 Tax=Methylobacterium aquaticum TaxID=270351 RepID=UPI00193134EF|nr:hypothetical protein [Methylobacterium aquaticum]QRE76623.1 hypothetical protein F1D61_26395 [Methylobacterium aquaticum]
MQIVPTTGIAALQMLQRTALRDDPTVPPVTSPSLKPQDPAKDPLALGQGTDAKARAAATAALFSVNHVTGEKLLMQRVEQLGQVLGVERSHYRTFEEFGAAIKDTMLKLTANPDDGAMISGIAARMKLDSKTVEVLLQQKTPDLLFHLIEQHLGLDKLGISLDSLVTAAQNPGGRDAERIKELLEQDSGPSKTDKAGQPLLLVTKDEDGLYRLAAGPEA